MTALQNLENRLWEAADLFRANSGLRSHEYSTPVLGLIFLKYADFKFTKAKEELEKENKKSSRRKISKTDFHAKGIVYLPESARFSFLLDLPEGMNLGKAVNEAMEHIERENKNLAGVLPKDYTIFENDVLVALLRNFAGIPMDVEGDVFGRIYEYFLGEFARNEGQKGGEFFTPVSIVRLIVEIIEPFHGRIYDPASGSGGMFVQSARFIEEHKKNPGDELSIFGQETVAETIRLAKMNLAVHGLDGDIKQGNSYYEDIHKSLGKFDFVMANPPFNVSGVDKEKIKSDKRYCYAIPRTDNGNYLWMQIFYSALNDKGRAGFVMSNAAADARQSDFEIRKQLVDNNAVDIMISISPQFFYTVILPCTLWFYDKGKKKTGRKDKILFIDVRNIYRQIDRAHRDFTPGQIQYIAGIAKIYRDEKVDVEKMEEMGKEWKKNFPKNKYRDITGLCKAASLDEVREQNYSLNPGRYVGVTEKDDDDFDFYEKLEELNEELEVLNSEARELEEKIAENIGGLLK